MSTVEGEAHVYRGGSWYYDREELLRSCVRSMEGTWVVRAFRGFRTFKVGSGRLELGATWRTQATREG